MSLDRAPMLFCPPHPPVRLAAGQTSAIGRHSSCQLVLRREDVSRRHCEVSFENGAYVVCDLGSTNGTFVNGQRVEGSRALGPGDRIEVGRATITFCEIDPEVVSDDDRNAKTMIAEPMPSTSAEAFQGDLAEVPPDALLQLLEMSHKSGLLELSSDDGTGRIWLDSGYPLHAETEKCIGFDAAIEVVLMTVGRFRFEPQVGCEQRTIQASVTELLLEASRQQDEAARE